MAVPDSLAGGDVVTPPNWRNGWHDSWGPGERPAGLYEVPGQLPRVQPGEVPRWAATHRARAEAERCGREAMQDRVIELGRRGWQVDATGDTRVQMSARSYRVHPLVTALLILCTVGAWIPVASYLQRRRDRVLLTLGHDYRLVETLTRGWGW